MYSLTIPRIAVPADGHRDPVRQLKTVRRPPIYPNGAQAISPAAPSPPFRYPHAVHRWIRVYALDSVLDLAPGATKEDLLGAMEGHVLGTGELAGERVGRKILKHQ